MSQKSDTVGLNAQIWQIMRLQYMIYLLPEESVGCEMGAGSQSSAEGAVGGGLDRVPAWLESHFQ